MAQGNGARTAFTVSWPMGCSALGVIPRPHSSPRKGDRSPAKNDSDASKHQLHGLRGPPVIAAAFDRLNTSASVTIAMAFDANLAGMASQK